MQLLSAVLCLLLGGCIGSQFLGRDVDVDQPFPSLHSVPEQPPAEDMESFQEALRVQDKSHEHNMQVNRELREQYASELGSSLSDKDV